MTRTIRTRQYTAEEREQAILKAEESVQTRPSQAPSWEPSTVAMPFPRSGVA